MKKVFVIGHQPRDEKMYPHTFDVLRLLERECRLSYYGGDDQGKSRYIVGFVRPSWNDPLSSLKALRHMVYCYNSERRIATEIRSSLKTEQPDVVVAIDHTALHHAARYCRRGTRLVFWSHDFYGGSDDAHMRAYWIRRLVRANRQDIKRCAGMIVQDSNRGAILDSIIGSESVARLYLPVSLLPDEVSAIMASKRQSQGSLEKAMLIQLGRIHANRASDRLLSAYQTLSSNIVLAFKGDFTPEIQDRIRASARKPLAFSRSESLAEMHDSISKADIGIISYAQKDLNHRFVSRASWQLAEYSRTGMPVIVLDVAELGSFVEQEGLGVSITDVHELEGAVKRMMSDYGRFAAKAYEAYIRYFNLENYGKPLLEFILGE